jgi:hypothetical protein
MESKYNKKLQAINFSCKAIGSDGKTKYEGRIFMPQAVFDNMLIVGLSWQDKYLFTASELAKYKEEELKLCNMIKKEDSQKMLKRTKQYK